MLSDTEIEALAERLACGPSFSHPALSDDELYALGEALDGLLANVRNLREAWEAKCEQASKLEAEIAQIKLDNSFASAGRCAAILATWLGHDEPEIGQCDHCGAEDVPIDSYSRCDRCQPRQPYVIEPHVAGGGL
jgi:hypothetical protein